MALTQAAEPPNTRVQDRPLSALRSDRYVTRLDWILNSDPVFSVVCLRLGVQRYVYLICLIVHL